MKVKEYTLLKTAEKTAKENNLEYVNGNRMSEVKMLFDFSFLETLNIRKDEVNAIKADATKNCSAANRTAFVFYKADDWTICEAIVDFNVHKVYSEKSGKLLYRIMEARHIKYTYAERKSVYDRYYNENVRKFEEDSKTDSPMIDYEI